MFGLGRISDETLVNQTLAGDREAFGKLAERYLSAVHGIAYAHLGNHADAEDAAQETFLKAYRSLDSLQVRGKFGAWLVSIARRESVQVFRRRKHDTGLMERLGAGTEIELPAVERRDTHETLREHIMALEENQREAILLFYFAGKSIRETASLLGISPAAAQKRVSRARETLSKSVVEALGNQHEGAAPRQERVKRVMGGIAGVQATWEISRTAASAGAANSLATISAAPLTLKVVSVSAASALAFVALWALAPRDNGVSPDNLPASSRVAAPVESKRADAASTAMARAENDATVASASSEQEATAARQSQRRGPGSIRGILTNEAGEGVPGVTVTSTTEQRIDRPWEEKEVRTVTTDAEGRFVFTQMPFGMHLVQALHDGGMALAKVSLSERYTLDREFVLELFPSKPITGRALDPNGQGLAKVAITIDFQKAKADLQFQDSRISRQDQFPFGQLHYESAEDGSFSLPVWDGDWSLTASCTGFGDITMDGVRAGTEDLVLPFGEGGSVFGRVILASTGESLSAISVIASPSNPTEENHASLRAETDASGNFSIKGLKDASYGLVIDDETYAHSAPAVVFTIGGDDKQIDVGELRALAGASVSGQVQDGETAGGIAKVALFVSKVAQSYPERIQRYTQTDEQGQFGTTGLPAGDYTVMAVGYAGVYGALEPATSMTKFSVNAGEMADSVIIRLSKKAGAHCSGRVVDAQGDAVENAIVDANIPGTDLDACVLSDANGNFKLSGLELTSELQLQARKRGLSCLQAGPFTITADGLDDVTLTMEPEASVSGVIVDDKGAPLPHGCIIVQPATEYPFGLPDARADRLGRFRVAGLSKGMYRIRPSSQSRMNGQNLMLAKNVLLDLKPGEHLDGVRVELTEKRGLSIAGRVVDARGQPVSGVSVRAQGQTKDGSMDHSHTRTDEDGKYEVTGLQGDRYLLIVQSDRHTNPPIQPVDAGSRDVNFVLGGTGVVVGRVVDAVTGKPIPNFRAGFGCQADGVASKRPMPYPMSSENGEFRFDGVPALNVFVVAEADGYVRGSVQVGEVKPDATTSGVEVRLSPGAVVEGIVRDPSGNPLAGASIFVGKLPNKYNRRESNPVATDSEGRFRLSSLAPGQRTAVIALHPSHAPACVDVVPNLLQPTSVEHTLENVGMLKGELWFDGARLAKHPVEIEFPGAKALNGGIDLLFTDDEGRFSWNGLPPGNATVVVKLQRTEQIDPPRLEYSQPVTIESDRETTTRVDLGNTWGGLEGAVTVLGQPAKALSAVIYIRVQTPNGEITYRDGVEDDGTFRYPQLSAGHAELQCSATIDDRSYLRELSAEITQGAITHIDFKIEEGDLKAETGQS